MLLEQLNLAKIESGMNLLFLFQAELEFSRQFRFGGGSFGNYPNWAKNFLNGLTKLHCTFRCQSLCTFKICKKSKQKSCLVIFFSYELQRLISFFTIALLVLLYSFSILISSLSHDPSCTLTLPQSTTLAVDPLSVKTGHPCLPSLSFQATAIFLC